MKKAADIEKTEDRKLRRSFLNMEKCYQGKTTVLSVTAFERDCSQADANQLQTIASELFAILDVPHRNLRRCKHIELQECASLVFAKTEASRQNEIRRCLGR
jgi:hypothetical protein